MFRDTGTMHILAVSGFNVSFVVFILFFILRAFYVNKKISALISIIFVVFFAAITGFSPSVVRASIMAVIVLLGIIIERDTDIFNSIAFSALLILLISPLDLFDVGFQLSYVATVGIVYFTPFIMDKLKFLPKWLSGSIGVSIGAQIFIIPLLINYFNRLSIVSIITNIFIIPIVGLITVLGFITFFLSFFLPLARLLGFINWFFLTLLVEIVRILSSIHYASVLVPSISFIQIILYYSVIIYVRNYSVFLMKWKILIISTLFITFFINSRDGFIHPKNSDGTLKITFLNLRGAYCQYVEFPDKTNMLIGGGGSYFIDQGERTVSQFLLKEKRKITLDNVVVTGTRASDCGGLYYILSNFRIKNLCVLNYSSKKYDSKTFSKYFVELMDLAKKEKIALKIYNEGDNVNKYVTVYENILSRKVKQVKRRSNSYANKKVELLLECYGKKFYLPSDNKKYLVNRDTSLEILISRKYIINN
jgi:competence protein ComEC